MKKLFEIVFPAAAAALVCVSPLPALAQDTGFYLKADAGGNITQDIKIEDLFGLDVSGVKLELEPGFRGGIGGGYKVTEWFAVEAELGIMYNEIHSMKGGEVQDGTFANLPFLVNVRFQLPPGRCPVTPYAGVGAGFAETILDVGSLAVDGVVLSGSDWESVFAWQAFAGLRYALNERMGLSVEYRYFQADGPSWEVDGAPGKFGLGRAETHALSLAYDFKF